MPTHSKTGLSDSECNTRLLNYAAGTFEFDGAHRRPAKRNVTWYQKLLLIDSCPYNSKSNLSLAERSCICGFHKEPIKVRRIHRYYIKVYKRGTASKCVFLEVKLRFITSNLIKT